MALVLAAYAVEVNGWYGDAVPPFVFTTPVRFADVDHAGIVYYPRFFHYFHLAFEELFRVRLGARAYVKLLDEDRIGFPAVRAEAAYQAPLSFGDTTEIELTVERLGRSSITFAYNVWRAAEPGRERVHCADGKVVTAVVDLSAFKSVPVPERIVALLSDLVTNTGDPTPGTSSTP
jgi:4-hydroxybenzoyl-CoA thioesterase